MALIEVAAFIMMHSGVDPNYKTKFINESNPYDSYYLYELTGREISKDNIHLYAPSILGYSYYDHQRSEEFLKEMNKAYIEESIESIESYTDYCLEKIHDFEKQHVADTKQALEKTPPTDDGRELRQNAHDMVTHKQRVEWKEHTHYITEKTYSIDSHDNPKNSIMVCCQKVDIDKQLIEKASKELNRNVKDTHYTYELEYDEDTKTCSIRFNTSADINYIPFTTIVDIIEIFLKSVLSPDIKYELSIFDFTCSEVEFTPKPTETPIFISYDKKTNTMIYGTNPTEEASKSERDKRVLSYAHPGSASPVPHLLRSEFKVYPGPADSPSPERPTPTIRVKLDSPITSFVDVNPIVELGGDSISVPSETYSLQDSLQDSLSSPIEVDGGSRRRRRRTIKKVSLRNRRRTKVRSKRSKRQRKTKSKR
jgi:hypothetical protein